MHGDYEIQSRQDRRESVDEYREAGFNDVGVAECGAEWRVESPTGVHAAGEDAVQHEHAAR